MINDCDELYSTQQSTNYCDYEDTYRPNLTTQRFLEQFCSIRISLSNRGDDCFYYVRDKKLKDLLGLNGGFSEYDFDKIISSTMYGLLVYGKTYIEQILYFDKKDNLVKIRFLPIRYKRMKRIFSKLYYSVKKFDGKYVRGHIDYKNLIVLNLRDMNYSKKHFKRIFRKQDKKERIYNDLMFSGKVKYDFELLRTRSELKDLKITRNVFWCKTPNNQYISEPYLLYRSMKFDLIQKDFLDYILEQINVSIKKLGCKYGFEGKIEYKAKTDKYDECFEKLNSGQMNCEEACNIVF